jgi:hypothetical protein
VLSGETRLEVPHYSSLDLIRASPIPALWRGAGNAASPADSLNNMGHWYVSLDCLGIAARSPSQVHGVCLCSAVLLRHEVRPFTPLRARYLAIDSRLSSRLLQSHLDVITLLLLLLSIV